MLYVIINQFFDSGDSIVKTLFFSLIGSLIAVVLTLIVEYIRRPKFLIKINPENSNLIPYSYPQIDSKWKFFKLTVINKQLLGFDFFRNTAINCRATITFKLNGKKKFSMPGRWGGEDRLQPADFKESQNQEFYAYMPDLNNLATGVDASLDIFTQLKGDECAYGFNNYSYLYGWKHENYKLEVGIYDVEVILRTQNGTTQKESFKINISNNIDNTLFVE